MQTPKTEVRRKPELRNEDDADTASPYTYLGRKEDVTNNDEDYSNFVQKGN